MCLRNRERRENIWIEWFVVVGCSRVKILLTQRNNCWNRGTVRERLMNNFHNFPTMHTHGDRTGINSQELKRFGTQHTHRGFMGLLSVWNTSHADWELLLNIKGLSWCIESPTWLIDGLNDRFRLRIRVLSIKNYLRTYNNLTRARTSVFGLENELFQSRVNWESHLNLSKVYLDLSKGRRSVFDSEYEFWQSSLKWEPIIIYRRLKRLFPAIETNYADQGLIATLQESILTRQELK